MDFELTVVQGRSANNTIKLSDGVTTIGRHDACQLRIKSAQVSRKHCEIFEKKGLLLVKDLKSSNGTIVNGKRIDGQRVLEPGDELTIGPIQLRVVKIGAPGASGSAKPGVKASDTAVTAAIGAEDDGDDFALSLDDTATGEVAAVVAPASTPAPKKPAPKAKTPPPADDDFADFLIDMPSESEEEEEVEDSTEKTQVVAMQAASKPSPPAEIIAAPAKPEAKQEKAKAPEESDDAIADFLLDIKLEDE